jgi:hypothetical protein
MTGLRQLFDELAERPPAPAPLAADELYAAGRRSRQRRRAAWGATATVAVGAMAAGAMGVIGVVAPDRPAPGENVAGPPGRSAPSPTVGSPRGAVQWVGAADATYLYRAVAACSRASVSCPKTRWRLSASTDGGRTWAERGAVIDMVDVTVLDRRTLVGVDWRSSAREPVVSLDGGRTWSEAAPGATVSGVTVAASVCRPAGHGSACQLYGLDSDGRFGRLGRQPALTLTDAGLVAGDGDRLWVGGHDPRSNQPGAAFSADGGHTWSVHAFPGFPDCADPGCHRTEVSAGHGGTAYAMVTDREARREIVYRATADGDWRHIGEQTLPAGVTSGGWSFVTRDGAHVVARYEDVAGQGTDRRRFWAARPGGRQYRPVPMTGLPDKVGAVRRAPDGWLYTHRGDGTVYGSTDGRHWAPTTD